MGTSPMSPEGDDVDSREVKTVDPREAALQKVMQEHGQIEAYGKGGLRRRKVQLRVQRVQAGC